MGTVTKFRTSNTKTSARTYKTTQVNNSSKDNNGVRTNKNSVQKRDYNRKYNNSPRKIDYKERVIRKDLTITVGLVNHKIETQDQ